MSRRAIIGAAVAAALVGAAATTEEREGNRVTCRDCGHTWIGFYTPMMSRPLAELMAALHCPKCGAGAARIVFSEAKDVAVTDEERATWPWFECVVRKTIPGGRAIEKAWRYQAPDAHAARLMYEGAQSAGVKNLNRFELVRIVPVEAP